MTHTRSVPCLPPQQQAAAVAREWWVGRIKSSCFNCHFSSSSQIIQLPAILTSMQFSTRPLWRIFKFGALATFAACALCALFGSSPALGRSLLLRAVGGAHESARLAEVKDLRNTHDTQIPFFLPPVLAFFASVVYGMTSFGEAITFMICWSLSGALGFLGSDYSFAKGVVYSSIINLIAYPITMWIAREEIRRSIWWGVYCSLMLMAFESYGVKVLLFDHTGYARHFIGIAFAIFAFWRANSAAHDFGRARAVSASPEPLWKDSDANAGAPYILDEYETTVLDSQERWNAHRPFVEKFLTDFPAVRRVYETAFPRCYESNKSTEAALAIFAAGFLVSGFMFGLASTGGPPVMVTFILLKVSKGAMRSIRSVAGLWSILVWLWNMFSHGSQGLHIFSISSDWPILSAIIIAGALGSSLGAWLRNFVSRDHLLFCFYFLIWGDAALLLGVFQTSSKHFIAFPEVIIATVVLFASVAVSYFQPDAVDALLLKSDEMLSMLSPRDPPAAISLSRSEHLRLVAHIEALKASGRLSSEYEEALNSAVECRDPRAAAALRQGGRDEKADGDVEEALLSLARRVVSERK